MKKILKRYWWIIVLVLAAPIMLNYIILIPAVGQIVGDSTDWLSFWGGYLSAIISAIIAFVILIVQREDNRLENVENREENKKENIKNREIQIKVLEYQQQKEWLNNFSKAVLENLVWYNPTCLNKIQQMMRLKYDYLHVQQEIMDLTNHIEKENNVISILIDNEKSSDNLKQYQNTLYLIRSKYLTFVKDFELLSTIYYEIIPKSQLGNRIINFYTVASDSLKQCLNSVGEDVYNSVPWIIIQLLGFSAQLYPQIRDASFNCIYAEQVRINSIINDIV